MSLSQAEFQIPEGYKEYPQPTPPIENEVIINDSYVVETNGSIDRGSIYYAKSAEIALENQARLRERRAIVKYGDTINRARQAELEKRLNAPKPSVARRVFKILTTGQLDSSALRIKPVNSDQLRMDVFKQLINHESSIGARPLNQSALVSRQEFFLSDIPSHPNEWFYHAESDIPNIQPRTIRYVVSEADGVFKSIGNRQYEPVVNSPADAELDNFVDLTKRYYKNVAGGLYKIPESSDYDLAA